MSAFSAPFPPYPLICPLFPLILPLCFSLSLLSSSFSPPQILSSRLIPAGDQEVNESLVQLFRRNFLESGGLKSVINVLQRNALPSEVDLAIRQDCYANALALSR